jgi:hypothetical protein
MSPDIDLDLPAFSTGRLDITSPPHARAWREHGDLVPLVLEHVTGARVLFTQIGDYFYGRFARAECTSDEHPDVCVWLIAPATHDPLLVTWRGQASEGRLARETVAAIRPGFFSAVVARAVGGATREIKMRKQLTPVTFAFSRDGSVLEGDDATGDVIARIGADGTIDVASAERHKKFLIRFDAPDMPHQLV